MKKKRIAALILAVFCLLSVCAVPASAAAYYTGSGTDLAKGKTAYLNSYLDVDKPITMLNDNIAACATGQKVYISEQVMDKNTADSLGNAPGKFVYTLTDGTVRDYYYTYEYRDLNVDCNYCYLYFDNCEVYYLDFEADILVSCDGGKTYTLAWSSAPYEYDENHVLETAFALPASRGGNLIGLSSKKDSYLFQMKYVQAFFYQTFKNATNIVYGCSELARLKSGYVGDGVQYDKVSPYTGRMTEFKICYSSSSMMSAPVTVSVTTDKDSYQIGDKIKVTVSLSGGNGIAGLFFSLTVPDEFIQLGTPVWEELNFNCEAENGNFLMDSAENETVNGKIVSCEYIIGENCTPGYTQIRAKVKGCVDKSGFNVVCYTKKSTPAVNNRLMGDVNEDGYLNVMDIIRLRNYLSSYDADLEQYTDSVSNAADIYQDGKTDSKDLLKLIDRVANQEPGGQQYTTPENLEKGIEGFFFIQEDGFVSNTAMTSEASGRAIGRVYAINGEPVQTYADINRILKDKTDGEYVVVTIMKTVTTQLSVTYQKYNITVPVTTKPTYAPVF